MGKIFDFEPYYKFLNIVLSRKIHEILLYQNLYLILLAENSNDYILKKREYKNKIVNNVKYKHIIITSYVK